VEKEVVGVEKEVVVVVVVVGDDAYPLRMLALGK
jgi:hypothetical protein